MFYFVFWLEFWSLSQEQLQAIESFEVGLQFFHSIIIFSFFLNSVLGGVFRLFIIIFLCSVS